jgi:hypothetical protein
MLEFSYRLVKSFERRIRRRIKRTDPDALPRDFEPGFKSIFDAARPYTMTSPARMYALYLATQHVVENRIAGDVVECGVWRGGSAMVAALTLLAANDTSRTIWLYDTFEGMTEPGERDVDLDGRPARMRWNTEFKVSARENGAGSDWCYASLEEVRHNVLGTGYPEDKVRFVRGKVEETIPAQSPQSVALLRLDTDWFESTWHELLHLYPRLTAGGALILDDYGSWKGSREATDKYFAEHGGKPFLARIDEAGRIAIKR